MAARAREVVRRFFSTDKVLAVLQATGDILPSVDVTSTLGSASKRFLQIFSRQVVVGGNADTTASVTINGAVSTRPITFQTAGVARAQIALDNTAESGANAGSNITITAFDDAGVSLGSILSIIRSTRKGTFGVRPAVSGAGDVETQDNKGQLSGYLGIESTGYVLPQNVRANSGSNAVGQGGAYDFGLAINLGFSPMASVKGKLTNAPGTELQGGVSLQYRPTGAAGQVLADGFEVSHTTTDNETVGILLTRISGSMVAKRVKVGAINTGPGGAGRAMFVDN